MIQLREMELSDLEIFKKWLYEPHVAKWYHDPQDWINEVENQKSEFCWIHHFIVEHEGKPMGFCQYYACQDSDEEWEGYTALGGSYSIDYMIGEVDCLRRGFGKMIVSELIDRIARQADAKRIVVQPEPENKASCGLLLSCGFTLDREKEIYVKSLPEAADRTGAGSCAALRLVGWNVVLDSDHADELAAFYEKLLGWTRFPGEEYTVLTNLHQQGLPTWITIQQVDDYVPPVWPATPEEQQQMAHLDFHVEDVEEAVEHALSCGAAISESQFDDRWRVMIDPAGHPFCILPPIMPWM